MSHFTVSFRTTTLIELQGPVFEVTGLPAVGAPASMTSNAYVVNDRKVTRLTVATAGGPSVAFVESVDGFSVGDTLIIMGADGRFAPAGDVVAIDVALKKLSISLLFPTADVGNLVAGSIGPEIPMSAYNLAGAVAGNFDYGWRGVIPANGAGLAVGTSLRIYVYISDISGTLATKVLRAIVVEDE